MKFIRTLVSVFWFSFFIFSNQAFLRAEDPPVDPDFQQAARLAHQKDFNSAIEVLNKRINENPKLPMAFANRGMAFYMKGDYERALTDFNKSLQLDPGFAMGYQGRGMVLFRQEKIDESIDQLNRAITLNPNFGLAYHNRAIAYCHKALFKSCLADLEKSRDIGYPVNPEFVKEVKRLIAEEDQEIWEKTHQGSEKLKEIPVPAKKESFNEKR